MPGQQLAQVDRREAADAGEPDERRAQRRVQIVVRRRQRRAAPRVRGERDLVVAEVGRLQPHLDAVRQRQHRDADLRESRGARGPCPAPAASPSARGRPSRPATRVTDAARRRAAPRAAPLRSPAPRPAFSGADARTTRLSSGMQLARQRRDFGGGDRGRNRRTSRSSASMPGAASPLEEVPHQLGGEAGALRLVALVVRALVARQHRPLGAIELGLAEAVLTDARELLRSAVSPCSIPPSLHARRHGERLDRPAERVVAGRRARGTAHPAGARSRQTARSASGTRATHERCAGSRRPCAASRAAACARPDRRALRLAGRTRRRSACPDAAESGYDGRASPAAARGSGAEVLADQRFDVRRIDVADDDDRHAVGAVVVAVEIAQALRRERS